MAHQGPCPSLSCHSSGAVHLYQRDEGRSSLLFTGKVILEWGEEVPDHRDVPRSPQQLLASPTADVGDFCVGEGKAKDPAEQRQERVGEAEQEQESLSLGSTAPRPCKDILEHQESPMGRGFSSSARLEQCHHPAILDGARTFLSTIPSALHLVGFPGKAPVPGHPACSAAHLQALPRGYSMERGTE